MMWYEIADFPGYRINHLAEVLSLKQASGPKIMKQTIDTKGYYVVGLRRDGKTKVIAVHLLMARTFLGPPPEPGMQVCHGPRGQLDNRLRNLSYGTQSKNNYDQVRDGTHPEASRTQCDRGHKFTEENLLWRWNKAHTAKNVRRCKECHRQDIAKYRAKKKKGDHG